MDPILLGIIIVLMIILLPSQLQLNNDKKHMKRINEELNDELALNMPIGYLGGYPNVRVAENDDREFINIYNDYFVIYNKQSKKKDLIKIYGKYIIDIEREDYRNVFRKIIIRYNENGVDFLINISVLSEDSGKLYNEIISLKERCK